MDPASAGKAAGNGEADESFIQLKPGPEFVADLMARGAAVADQSYPDMAREGSR